MKTTTLVTALSAAAILAITPATFAQDVMQQGEAEETWLPITGAGVHYFSTSVKHSEEASETGAVIRSTDIVSLTGDLTGTVLYHPVTVIDAVAGTLTNNGHQVFSGTVLGGEPVLLLDDNFAFEVALATGAAEGIVLFDRTLAGPETICRLSVTGTGEMTADGDSLFTYEGACLLP